jgi:hypothetical protein
MNCINVACRRRLPVMRWGSNGFPVGPKGDTLLEGCGKKEVKKVMEMK